MKKILFALVVLLLSSPAFAQFSIISTPLGTITPYVTVGAGFPRLQAALTNPANQIVPCFGESTPAGLGSFYQTPTLNGAGDSLSGSFCNQVAIQLRQLGYNVRSNSFFGNGNVGANAAAAVARDTRMSAGTWVVGSSGPSVPCSTVLDGTFNIGPGGCYWNNTDNTSPLTFTPADTATYPQNTAYPTDAIDVWTFNIAFGVGGILTVDNGGTACGTINLGTLSGGGFTYTRSTITCPSAGTVWHFVATTGTDYISGARAYNSAKPEVSIVNMSIAGALLSWWLQSNGTLTVPRPVINQIADMNPVAAIFQDLGNDISAGTATGTVTSQTSTIISTLQPTADFLLITFNPQQPDTTVNNGKSPYTTQASYVTAQMAGATAQNAAIFNWWKYLCGSATGNTTATKDCWQAGQGGGWNAQNAGNTADPDHQGGIAYATEAAQIVQAIRPLAIIQ